MKLCIVGTGYVGLVVGTCMAETGNDVVCIDVDKEKIDKLNKGISPIHEPGLTDLIQRNLHEERLTFDTDLKAGVENAQVIFLCLPTPPMEDGSADLQHVLKVASEIGKLMNGYKVIVNRSTVPVGTAQKMTEIIRKETDKEFDVVSNPEFLKEGAAVNDFMKPDRIVIGTRSERARAIMRDLVSPFIRTGNPVIEMDERSAEVTKYAANGFLATKISFMNELANLCERVGADIELVRKGIGSDPRIGTHFLFPGIGFGGSCFPKDVRALLKTSISNDAKLLILDAVQKINDRQKIIFTNKIFDHFKGDVSGLQFTVWGLSFKPNTDDLREAPALEIINSLLEKGASIVVHDPVAMDEARKILGDKVVYSEKYYGSLEGADALIIATEWNEFRHPTFNRMKSLMKSPVVFDGRNIYDPKVMKDAGFIYFGVGRTV